MLAGSYAATAAPPSHAHRKVPDPGVQSSRPHTKHRRIAHSGDRGVDGNGAARTHRIAGNPQFANARQNRRQQNHAVWACIVSRKPNTVTCEEGSASISQCDLRRKFVFLWHTAPQDAIAGASDIPTSRSSARNPRRHSISSTLSPAGGRQGAFLQLAGKPPATSCSPIFRRYSGAAMVTECF